MRTWLFQHILTENMIAILTKMLSVVTNFGSFRVLYRLKFLYSQVLQRRSTVIRKTSTQMKSHIQKFSIVSRKQISLNYLMQTILYTCSQIFAEH